MNQEKDILSSKQPAQILSLRSRRLRTLAATLILGAMLSFGAAYAVWHWEQEKQALRFTHEAEAHVEVIREAVKTKYVQLQSMTAFFCASQEVTRSEFRSFVAPYFTYLHSLHSPSIQALEWIPRIPAAERARYETAARADGFTDFQITEKNAQGQVVRAGERTEYFPVYFMEPYMGNEKALGYDLASNPARRQALELCRDSGEPVATAPVRLIQETGLQKGFMIFWPVYQGNPILLEERRDGLRGFALGVFRVGDLVADCFQNQRGLDQNIYLFDRLAPAGEKLLFGYSMKDSQPLKEDEAVNDTAALKTGLYFERMVDVGGRFWTMVVTPASRGPALLQDWTPLIVLLAGLMITAILAGYFSAVISGAERNRLFAERMERSAEELKQEITEREEAEVALQESSSRLQTITKSAKDAIIMIDSQGLITFWNPAAETIFGYAGQEALGQNAHELLAPQPYLDAHRKAFPEFLRTGRGNAVGKTVELTGKHKDGRIIPVDVSLSAIQIQNQWHAVAIIRDITDRKQNEDKIRRISDMQRIVNMLMSFSLGETSIEDVMKYSLDLLTSLSWLSIMPKGAAFLYDARDQGLKMIVNANRSKDICNLCSSVPTGKCLCGKAILTGQIQFASHMDDRHEVKYQGMPPHGHYCIPIRSANKKLGVLCLYLSDGHQKNKDEENLLGMFADAMADIITRKKSDSRLKQMNNCFLSFGHDPVENIQLLTQTAGELMEANFATYSRMSGASRGLVAKWNLPENYLVNGGQPGTINYDIIHADGNSPVLLDNLPGTKYASGDINVVNCRLKAALGQAIKYIDKNVGGLFLGYTYEPKLGDDDTRILGIITAAIGIEEARIKAENERKASDAMRQQAQKLESIGQLASGIAHEINTPMQYVGDNTKFLQKSFEDLALLLNAYSKMPAEIKAQNADSSLLAELEQTLHKVDVDFLNQEIPVAIQQSLEGIDRVTRIVRAMRDMAHKDSAEKTPSDLNRIIESTVTVSRHEWKYVSEMELHLDPNMPAVPCLPGEFSQVILNLVVNASHAITDVVGDGSKGKGIITISTRVRDGMAEIAVKDTGTGIPEEHRQRIFEPFFTTKQVGKGTGQGLAICRNVIVKKHGGTMNFETQTGKGTSFIIRLPLE